MNTFSAGSCVRFGWETFKKRPWFLIGALMLAALGYTIISAVVTDILAVLIGTHGSAAALETLVRYTISAFMGLGILSFSLKAHDEVMAVRIADLWHPHPFWRYVGAGLLTGAAFVIGLILFIVPGIIALTMFMFAGYLVIDKGLGPIAALKESARITKGNRLELLLLVLAVSGLTLLGLICLIVGVFVVLPICTLASVHAYRVLSGTAHSSTQDPTPAL